MMILDDEQREELLKEMRALAEKYGVEITENPIKERTDIQKAKDNFFEQIKELPIERLNDSNAILNIGEIVQTKRYYEIEWGRKLGFYNGETSYENFNKCFKKDFPNGKIISKKYGVSDKGEDFVEYTFTTNGFLKINLSIITEADNNFYIDKKQWQKVYKEEKKVKKIEKLFNEIF